ncbi:MAG: site-specific integrase [Phycisphaerae bacterium]|nr:site-specific integrase [Phycisphaerae bacterium]
MRTPWDITREMFLSVSEAETLLGHVQRRAKRGSGRAGDAAKLDELILTALLFSGLRNSEFCGLTLADAVLGDGGPAFVVRPSRGEARTVWLPAAVGTLVSRWIEEIRLGLLPAGADPSDAAGPLVVNERGRPFQRSGLYRRVVRILTAAGLGDRASVQLLRHTYGYLAYLRTGGNLLFVQRQLGHAHAMVTSIYAQFVDESYPVMANSVAGMIAAEPRPTRALATEPVVQPEAEAWDGNDETQWLL